MKPFGPFFIFLYAGLFSGCGGAQAEIVPDPAISESLRALQNATIFFGHQSVGTDILNGIDELSAAHGVDVRIEEKLIGRNEYPDEKIADFARIMRSGVANDVDIALMKFCYADSGHRLSAQEIYSAYVDEMERLEREYPEAVFVYVTMPLRAPRSSVKNVVKRVLRMDVWGREDNVERERFNDMLRSAKADSGRLFDLAAVESTRRDGSVHTFAHDGESYRSLVPEYTDDGGHLNETGRRVVASELVLFLGRLQERLTMVGGQ